MFDVPLERYAILIAGLYAGHLGHSWAGGVFSHERPVHQDRGRIPDCLRRGQQGQLRKCSQLFHTNNESKGGTGVEAQRCEAGLITYANLIRLAFVKEYIDLPEGM